MGSTKSVLWAGLGIALFVTAAVSGRPVLADDETFGLPDAPGREDVLAYCGACHSMKLVVQQGLDRQGWAETLEWMYDEQEMPRLEPDEEKLVLDYLAKHVGPEGREERLRRNRAQN